MKNPGFNGEYPPTNYEVVPPVFRLGDGARNYEHVENGRRLLTWMLSGEDLDLASVAGWHRFKVEYRDGVGELEIPAGTRNGRSVLAGVEAWHDEKRSLVETVTGYISQIHERYQMFDTQLSWSQVGVTPMHEVFVAPPNTPQEAGLMRVKEWKQKMATELALILRNDKDNRGLAVIFESEIDRISENDG